MTPILLLWMLPKLHLMLLILQIALDTRQRRQLGGAIPDLVLAGMDVLSNDIFSMPMLDLVVPFIVCHVGILSSNVCWYDFKYACPVKTTQSNPPPATHY